MKIYASFILVVLLLMGCANSASSEEEKVTVGTVKYNSLEGGFYGIITDDNQSLDPINLPKEFQVDGKRIHFSYKEKKDRVSIHMWGIIIEIIQIKPE